MMDISKILENAPKRLKLWSPIFGEVEFQAVSKNTTFKAGVSIDVFIPNSRYCYVSFNSEGKLEDNAPDICFLQPSRNSFWSDPWQMGLMEPGKVVRYHEDLPAISPKYVPVMIYDKSHSETLVEVKFKNGDIEKVEPSWLSFASKEDVDNYADTSSGVLKSKPEIKEEEKPWSLKPFDKFLYRATKEGVWNIGFFGYREVSVVGDPDYNWDYFTVGRLYFGTEVLPYNDETKHLHRTSKSRVGNWAMIPTILE